MSDSAQDKQAKAEQIFLEAFELPPDGRDAFLDRQCGHDADLRTMVHALLAADEAAGDANFLESRFLPGASPAPQSSGVPARSAGQDQESTAAGEAARFQLLSRYEQGGLGEVLIAHDRQLDREVAVKQIRPKWLGNEEARERFLQEAAVTGRLEHPGIVPVYAMGKWEDGRPFYAMRFIQGMTLKQVIARGRSADASLDPQAKRMELRALLNRFVDVCNTMEYAHSRQVLHRDIKPSNIMIGPYGETLIVDWGLAKLLDAPFEDSFTAGLLAQNSNESGSSRTQLGGTVGTPQYMSPEQAAGDLASIGIRTDVYLLGATLYQILTGVPPHQGNTVSELIDRVKRGMLSRPRDIDPDVPAPLQAICLKAMAHDAAGRYRSAAELSADIERWLADQPVTVYHDPASVRLGRWIRQHRTMAMSGAVAAILLTVGSVVGSSLWSYQQSRQLKTERERNLKEAQLAASRQQRLRELEEASKNALELSNREIEADRYSAALRILRNAAEAIGEDESLQDKHDQILAKAERLERIVEFHRQSELSEQLNVTSRDTQGILAAAAGLKALGIWDRVDWWNALPGEDLTPRQQDRLRWDVYQQWLMLDGMLVKTIGTRLFGTSNTSATRRILSALRRLGSDAGKREAEAALAVSDRIDWFRQSESARWYRSIAQYRLGEGRRLKGEEIGMPTNAPDSQKLGVLCMLSAMDPSFAIVFRDYRGQDPITAGRDLFQRSASLRPDHYWTQIALGQMQYFLAEQNPRPSWESYQPAIQTMGRCIVIDPDCCFAYADRSSLFRFQWEAIQNLDGPAQAAEPPEASDQPKASDQPETTDPPNTDPPNTDAPADPTDPAKQNERRLLVNATEQQRAADLLRWSLQDAQTAYRLGGDQPWVGWTYGMSLAAAGQLPQALEVLLEASRRTLPLMEIGDATLIRSDDIRGRSDAAAYAVDMIDRYPDDLSYRILLASIRLNQENDEEALEQVESALDPAGSPAHAPPTTQALLQAHAHAVRGMIRLHQEHFDEAADDFQRARSLDPSHVWAWYGAAACDDAVGRYQAAIENYQQALQLATTDEHRSACLLGIGRCEAFLGHHQRAIELVTQAQQLQPACDVESVARPLLDRFRALRTDASEAAEWNGLKDCLQSLGELLRSKRIEFEQASTGPLAFDAPLLNGDFELEVFQYWGDEFGAAWRNEAGYRSRAAIVSDEAHEGRFSLQILGSDPDDPAQQGRTGQRFPVPADSRCRLSLWAKAQGLGRGAVRIAIEDLAELELEPGTYEWRQYEVAFQVGEAPDPTLTVVPLELRMECSGPGRVHLDELRVQVTREE